MNNDLCQLIAVIDDEPIARFITEQTIRLAYPKIQLLAFSNGNDALQYLTENREKSKLLPELILLDIDMPIMNGWMFIEKYQSLSETFVKPIEVYVLSSSINPADKARVDDNLTVKGFIDKPLTADKLKNFIK